ncbi:hypothetical protein DEJ50_03155 [Streptomyces venezuelae]|uniref:Uncharacterized protein n=1 Tax=Streptomyces venezuelae TaxID=54571 RepID=A0A5P2CXM1_STRVZ|nr:hypothetical protein DEJ50_03155 [Streptomyces venezuelae]
MLVASQVVFVPKSFVTFGRSAALTGMSHDDPRALCLIHALRTSPEQSSVAKRRVPFRLRAPHHH